jgi:hypothetical protein
LLEVKRPAYGESILVADKSRRPQQSSGFLNVIERVQAASPIVLPKVTAVGKICTKEVETPWEEFSLEFC